MPEPKPLNIIQLLRALDAKIIDHTAQAFPDQCVVCGCGLPADPEGVKRLCLQCSLAETGETWPGLAHRVSHKLTKAQWDKLETIEDVPRYRYREWVRKFMR